MPQTKMWSPSSPVSEVALNNLALRLGAVVDALPPAAHHADENPEYVHDLRVASRRSGGTTLPVDPADGLRAAGITVDRGSAGGAVAGRHRAELSEDRGEARHPRGSRRHIGDGQCPATPHRHAGSPADVRDYRIARITGSRRRRRLVTRSGQRRMPRGGRSTAGFRSADADDPDSIAAQHKTLQTGRSDQPRRARLPIDAVNHRVYELDHGMSK